MIFHRAVRRAIVALLNATPKLSPSIYSAPPVNLRHPLILVGRITADEPLSKDSPGGFYQVEVESWIQGQSPAELDALSDAVALRLHDATMTDADAVFGSINFAGENDTADLAATGGPTLGRVQTFRLFAQPHD